MKKKVKTKIQQKNSWQKHGTSNRRWSNKGERIIAVCPKSWYNSNVSLDTLRHSTYRYLGILWRLCVLQTRIIEWRKNIGSIQGDFWSALYSTDLYKYEHSRIQFFQEKHRYWNTEFVYGFVLVSQCYSRTNHLKSQKRAAFREEGDFLFVYN